MNEREVARLIGEPVANVRVAYIGHVNYPGIRCKCPGPRPYHFFDLDDGRLGELSEITGDLRYDAAGDPRWPSVNVRNFSIYAAGTTTDAIQAPNEPYYPTLMEMLAYCCCRWRRTRAPHIEPVEKRMIELPPSHRD